LVSTDFKAGLLPEVIESIRAELGADYDDLTDEDLTKASAYIVSSVITVTLIEDPFMSTMLANAPISIRMAFYVNMFAKSFLAGLIKKGVIDPWAAAEGVTKALAGGTGEQVFGTK
jgi:hypothetical protein